MTEDLLEVDRASGTKALAGSAGAQLKVAL
jgi:hypothetical protein